VNARTFSRTPHNAHAHAHDPPHTHTHTAWATSARRWPRGLLRSTCGFTLTLPLTLSPPHRHHLTIYNKNGALTRCALALVLRQVIYYKRTPLPKEEENGATYKSLDDLLAESDFISIHTPLTDATCTTLPSPLLSDSPTLSWVDCWLTCFIRARIVTTRAHPGSRPVRQDEEGGLHHQHGYADSSNCCPPFSSCELTATSNHG